VTNGARRPLAAVIGSARAAHIALADAESVGCALVDVGFRVATGGLTGVMDAALAGARRSAQYREGDTLAFLPSYGDEGASAHSDVVIRTGLQHARNVVMIATVDVVLAIGGRAGTLTEIALAWELSKPVIVVGMTEGWATRLAGQALDDRREDRLIGPLSPVEAAQHARRLVGTLGSSREYR
jgi:uncharacterized protein (TIGR00725 family)